MITALVPYPEIQLLKNSKSPAFEVGYFKPVPKEILHLILDMLPTDQAISFTAICKQFRTDKTILKLIGDRIGLDPKEYGSWKVLSQKLKKETPYSFPYNLAAKNLLEIPKKIITEALIEQLNQKALEKKTLEKFVFICEVTREGMLIPFKTPSSIPVVISLIQSVRSDNNVVISLTYKMSIHVLDLPTSISQRGLKILNTTTALFNTIFAFDYSLKYQQKHFRYYQFLCNAARPYTIFSYAEYNAVISEETKNKMRNLSKITKFLR
jgi:hypothetical protein